VPRTRVGASRIATNGGAVPNGFCASAYVDAQRTQFRIRQCSASLNPVANTASTATVNQWQDITEITGLFDDPGAVLLQATHEPVPTGAQNSALSGGQDTLPGFVANDAAFGGNGSPVISWPPVPEGNAANEGWTASPA
jgi:hypothetical protein